MSCLCVVVDMDIRNLAVSRIHLLNRMTLELSVIHTLSRVSRLCQTLRASPVHIQLYLRDVDCRVETLFLWLWLLNCGIDSWQDGLASLGPLDLAGCSLFLHFVQVDLLLQISLFHLGDLFCAHCAICQRWQRLVVLNYRAPKDTALGRSLEMATRQEQD